MKILTQYKLMMPKGQLGGDGHLNVGGVQCVKRWYRAPVTGVLWNVGADNVLPTVGNPS